MKKEWLQHYHIGKLSYIILNVVLFLTTFKIDNHNWLLLVLAFIWLPIAWQAFKELFLEKKLGSELFFVFATVVALIGHEERAIMIVLLVVLVAEYLEDLVKERTEHAVESLVKLIPTDVWVQTNGTDELRPISEVSIGQRVIVKTGFPIPVDGVIISGSAGVNEASLTGESKMKQKEVRDLVYAGTFIESGSIVVEVQKLGQDTLFGKITALLKEADKRKAGIESFANKLALILTPLIVIFIGIVWLITRDLQVVITLLVFGSPIELALVTPLTILAGTVSAFNQGILVKGGQALERFAKADTIVFDKTGTLTIGQPKVVSVEAVDADHDKKAIIRMSAIAEKRSGHVLSKAILNEAQKEGLTVPDPDSYVSISGHGVEVTYKNDHYRLGSKHFIEAPEHGNIHVNPALACSHGSQSHTSFYLACGDKLCGMICVADEVRSEAREVVEALKAKGIKQFILLSGDRQNVAEQVAQKLGIQTVYGEVLPDKKLATIKELQQQGHVVAMIGDGINDAPALKQADVGIAMGAMGMEPAIEASDIALMSNDLKGVIVVYELSRKTIRTIKQNIIIGLGFTHGLGMILALLRILNPIHAAFFHAVPDLLILLNSARLTRFRDK